MRSWSGKGRKEVCVSKYREDDSGNLVLDDGTVIPVAERKRTEVYSRVVGYLRPVEQWNRGKQEEYRDRRAFRPEPAPVGRS